MVIFVSGYGLNVVVVVGDVVFVIIEIIGKVCCYCEIVFVVFVIENGNVVVVNVRFLNILDGGVEGDG